MELRCKLKGVMDSRGLSQMDVSRGAGVTPGAVGRMYRDQLNRIDTTTISKVAQYLGITEVNQLFEFVE